VPKCERGLEGSISSLPVAALEARKRHRNNERNYKITTDALSKALISSLVIRFKHAFRVKFKHLCTFSERKNSSEHENLIGLKISAQKRHHNKERK
jgi:hypothetical protein